MNRQKDVNGWTNELLDGREVQNIRRIGTYYVLTVSRFTLSVRLVTKGKQTNIKLNLFSYGKITC
jgi:hypothetical protein